jgi:hypothetical protein
MLIEVSIRVDSPIPVFLYLAKLEPEEIELSSLPIQECVQNGILGSREPSHCTVLLLYLQKQLEEGMPDSLGGKPFSQRVAVLRRYWQRLSGVARRAAQGS